MVYEKKNRSLVFSGSRKIPTLGSTVQWETRQASFSTGTMGPRVGIFLSPLITNDGFYLSHMGSGVGQIESIIGVQWGQKNPNPRAHRSSGKRGLSSFPLDGGPEGWDFSGTTEHQ